MRMPRGSPISEQGSCAPTSSVSDTRLIDVDGATVGSVAVRTTPAEHWLEHFYLAADQQGRGIGGAVLRRVLAEPRAQLPWRLNVLQGSAARRLYERHGFVFEHEDEVDVWLVRR
jgi:GNAT superfamily N-acetyltransferase